MFYESLLVTIYIIWEIQALGNRVISPSVLKYSHQQILFSKPKMSPAMA